MDDSTSKGVLLRYDNREGDMAVVIDDDNRVAYAYLLMGDDIVSDVWLYNIDPPPEEIDWADRSKMPFLSPLRFCRDDVSSPRLSPGTDVRCEWSGKLVDIFVDGIWTARLEVGQKPAWSLLASRPGPLARPLPSAERLQ